MTGLTITQLVKLCGERAKSAGWYKDYDRLKGLIGLANLPEDQRTKLLKFFDVTYNASRKALIHSEISESLEGVRKGLQDDHLPQFTSDEVENADALIRIFDYAHANGLRLEEAVMAKLAYNAVRPDHKKEAREAEGGKTI